MNHAELPNSARAGSACESWNEVTGPKGLSCYGSRTTQKRYACIATMAENRMPVQLRCLALGGRVAMLRVALAAAFGGAIGMPGRPSRSGRCIPSSGTYGARRVHILGLGLRAGHRLVEMLMGRAAINGLFGMRRPRPRHEPDRGRSC